MRWATVLLTVAVSGCQATPPPIVTAPPYTPAAARTAGFATQRPSAATSPLVAVAAASATPTVVLVGDYASLVRPRVDAAQSALIGVEQQLAQVQQAPLRMAQDDWRSQMQVKLDAVAAADDSLRALGARSGSEAALYGEIKKLLDDLDYVVSEYRMAFDFDPDGSHFLRANRAEKAAADEVESIRTELRRSIGATITPSPAR